MVVVVMVVMMVVVMMVVVMVVMMTMKMAKVALGNNMLLTGISILYAIF